MKGSVTILIYSKPQKGHTTKEPDFHLNGSTETTGRSALSGGKELCERVRVRSMIAERTTVIDDERFLLLNQDEIEDVKQEDFNKSGIFTKHVGGKEVKAEDVTVIDSESENEDIMDKRKRRFVQGFPAKRIKGE